MRKLLYILLLALLPMWGCYDDSLRKPDGRESIGVPIVLSTASITTPVGDPDNMPAEYSIVNLSIFFADAGSTTINSVFVHPTFSSIDFSTIGNTKLVNLPLTPGALTNQDIYVVANCSDVAAMNAVQTVADIKALQTPAATTATGLTTTAGLPMYGTLPNADLNTSTVSAPLNVLLTRACAKIRVTVTFTGPTWVGTNNRVQLQNAAPYTFYVPGNIPALATSALINYPITNLTAQSAQQFSGIVYVYESATAPQLQIYTTVSGTTYNYTASANFPVPVRNYLYDIEIQILPPTRSGLCEEAEVSVRVKEW
ncbi:MAG: DUF4906 domain-containing protein [Rikenellaceae bacterium]|nr:DUF4906 domain-containing protein [Rikenellaceae bacterium]MCL2691879.1 DUF4906 domain-containing protein [Rikenellaceae bacterium]